MFAPDRDARVAAAWRLAEAFMTTGAATAS